MENKKETCREASHEENNNQLSEKQREIGLEILEFIKTKGLKVREAQNIFLELANSVLYTPII